MTYDNFKEQLISMLAERLPRDTRIEVQPILKNNNLSLDGLLLSAPEANISPTIYLNYYYEWYQDGRLLTEICDHIIELYEKNRLDHPIDFAHFGEYDKVKDHIIFKLIHAEKNQELLKDVPFVPYLDFAIVFCYLLPQESCELLQEDVQATILLRDSHIKQWDVSVEEVYARAKENTPRLLEPQMRPISEVVCELFDFGEECGLTEEDLVEQVPLFVLSNTKQFMGAAVMLYPEILEKCADMFAGDFYILPSSIHEVLLFPKNDDFLEEELTQMVRSVNEEHVAVDEVLSDHVYYYEKSSATVNY